MDTNPAPHVLRTVRRFRSLSQARLAALVGCSLPTIKKIESGQLRPSADLADRIAIQTGLDPDQLVENFLPETPLGPGGEPLTKETVKLIQERHRESQTKEQVDASLRHFGVVEEVLFDASTRHGKLWALRLAFRQAIDKLISGFDLEKDFARLLLARFGLKDPWSHGGGPAQSLYAIVNAELFEKQLEQAQAKRREFYGPEKIKPEQRATAMSLKQIIAQLPKLSREQRWELELRLRELDQEVIVSDSIAVEGAALLTQMEREDERRHKERQTKRRLAR